MPLRADFHIHQIQPGLDIGGKLAFHKIDHDAARRRGLHILLADRRRRIHRDHVHAAAPGLQRQLFGHELRALVGADHIRQRHRRIFIRGMPVLVEADGGHARSVDHAPHANLAGGVKNCPRALYVRAIHLLWIAHPEAVVGGHVEDRLAARHCFFERRRVAEIAGRGLCFESLQIF